MVKTYKFLFCLLGKQWQARKFQEVDYKMFSSDDPVLTCQVGGKTHAHANTRDGSVPTAACLHYLWRGVAQLQSCV